MSVLVRRSGESGRTRVNNADVGRNGLQGLSDSQRDSPEKHMNLMPIPVFLFFTSPLTAVDAGGRRGEVPSGRRKVTAAYVRFCTRARCVCGAGV